jgi:hypothetical protein
MRRHGVFRRFRWWVLAAGLVVVLGAAAVHYRSELGDQRGQLADAQATLSTVRANGARLRSQDEVALAQSEARLARLQQDLAAERERVAELRRVSPYPRGAFGWCPSVAGTFPVDPQTASAAGAVAVAFDLALNHHAVRQLAGLVDPTITQDTLVPHTRRVALSADYWAMTGLARGVHMVGGGPGRHDGLAGYGCGRAVAARTWIVGVHDASNTASAGGASFYLVRRRSGWKVWGSY